MEQITGNAVPARMQIAPIMQAARTQPRRKRAWMSANVEEPGLAFWIAQVTDSFFVFAREARKLERLSRKMRSPLSSDGYNYLLEQQVGLVHCTFAAYMKSREETFAYIKSHYWRSPFFGRNRAIPPARSEKEEEIDELIVRAS